MTPLLPIITAGIGAVGSVTSLLRALNPPTNNQDLQLEHLVSDVRALHRQYASSDRRAVYLHSLYRRQRTLLSAYYVLIQALRENQDYSSRLEFHETSYGTWRLVRIKRTDNRANAEDNLRLFRREDNYWISQRYTNIRTTQNRLTGAISWFWELPGVDHNLLIRYTHPPSQISGCAILRIHCRERLILFTEIVLDEVRFDKMEQAITDALAMC
jgi:hypothetical protein